MKDRPSSKHTKKRGKNFQLRAVSEIVGKVLEPVLARRTGMTLDLITAWPELVGEEFRETTRPEKIDWPRRAHEDDPFKPATLIVACENSVALFFQHEQSPLLERINVFFGFEAIGRIRILQKAVLDQTKKKAVQKRKVSSDDEVKLAEILDAIDDPDLKETLQKLGRGVLSRKETDKP